MERFELLNGNTLVTSFSHDIIDEIKASMSKNKEAENKKAQETRGDVVPEQKKKKQHEI